MKELTLELLYSKSEIAATQQIANFSLLLSLSHSLTPSADASVLDVGGALALEQHEHLISRPA